jgi:hypothetical protein
MKNILKYILLFLVSILNYVLVVRDDGLNSMSEPKVNLNDDPDSLKKLLTSFGVLVLHFLCLYKGWLFLIPLTQCAFLLLSSKYFFKIPLSIDIIKKAPFMFYVQVCLLVIFYVISFL